MATVSPRAGCRSPADPAALWPACEAENRTDAHRRGCWYRQRSITPLHKVVERPTIGDPDALASTARQDRPRHPGRDVALPRCQALFDGALDQLLDGGTIFRRCHSNPIEKLATQQQARSTRLERRRRRSSGGLPTRGSRRRTKPPLEIVIQRPPNDLGKRQPGAAPEPVDAAPLLRGQVHLRPYRRHTAIIHRCGCLRHPARIGRTRPLTTARSPARQSRIRFSSPASNPAKRIVRPSPRSGP